MYIDLWFLDITCDFKLLSISLSKNYWYQKHTHPQTKTDWNINLQTRSLKPHLMVYIFVLRCFYIFGIMQQWQKWLVIVNGWLKISQNLVLRLSSIAIAWPSLLPRIGIASRNHWNLIQTALSNCSLGMETAGSLGTVKMLYHAMKLNTRTVKILYLAMHLNIL